MELPAERHREPAALFPPCWAEIICPKTVSTTRADLRHDTLGEIPTRSGSGSVRTVLACLIPVGVSAQNPGIQELLNRVDRLQRELTALQRHVYQGKTAPAAASQPSSSVPADPPMAARHSVRITQLENEISRLTGRMEEIDFALSRIEARLDKLVVDLDQRLTALERGAPHRRCGNAPARFGAAQ